MLFKGIEKNEEILLVIDNSISQKREVVLKVLAFVIVRRFC